jgi:serine/threonine protein kinase
MAPEVFNRQPQTTKVDIWSLFVTIVWTRTPEFRQSCSHMRAPDLHTWLVGFSKMELYANIRRMASMEPRKRPSATKQLAILDGGAAGGGGFDDYASVSSSYGSNHSGDDALGGDLGAQFSRVMTLRDDTVTPGLTYGSGGSSEAVTSPEMPYYEPYATKVMQSVQDYFGGAQAGPSKRSQYVLPSPDLAGEPRVSLPFCSFPPFVSRTLWCC